MSVDRLHLTHSKQTYRTLFKSNGFCFPRFFNLVIKVQKMFFQVKFFKLTSSATVKAIRFAGFWKPPWTKVLVRADRRTCHDGNLDFEGWKKTHPRGHLWVQKSLLCLEVCSEHLSRSCCQKKEAKYHMRPKVHFMGHTVWHYLPKNPKYLWYTLMRIWYPVQNGLLKRAIRRICRVWLCFGTRCKHACVLMEWLSERCVDALKEGKFVQISPHRQPFKHGHPHNSVFFWGCTVWHAKAKTHQMFQTFFLRAPTDTFFSHLRRSHATSLKAEVQKNWTSAYILRLPCKTLGSSEGGQCNCHQPCYMVEPVNHRGCYLTHLKKVQCRERDCFASQEFLKLFKQSAQSAPVACQLSKHGWGLHGTADFPLL